MSYTPAPNPWKNVPYVGALIDGIQSFLSTLTTTITIRKETVDVGSRPAIDFHEGTLVNLTITDDGVNDEVDVTVAVDDSAAVQFSNLIQYDLFANRPSASIAGRLFFASDTGAAYRDNGATWDVVEDDSGYQPLDSDLTAIAGLSHSNDDIIQAKSGAWTNRTMSELNTDLITAGLPAGLVAGGLPADLVGYGAVGSRPAASEAGLLYYATDEGVLYRDNGSTWDPTVSDQIALIVALGGD